MNYWTWIFLIILFPFLLNAQNEENLDVLYRWAEYTDLDNALYHHYAKEAFKLCDKRESEIAKLKTKEDWIKRQTKVRKTLLKLVGPFPEKTPLNSRVTGTLKGDDFYVEKLIYESRPNFYVSAALFIPDNLKEKAPAVIFPNGHTNISYRHSFYQKTIINMVKKGFIVLTFDPVGQGERVQYFDPDLNKSVVGGPTMEHSYAGMQCLLNGSSMANFEIWDGIRAVDYLFTRPEVDTKRIAITGISGGGTQSAYIGAIDERIYISAPECFITSSRRLFQSWAPQDGEQSIFHGLLNGIDHADFIEIRAPKPTLQITTTRDFFNIQGARETEQEAKKVYAAYGAEENFKRAEDDAPHTITAKNSATKYAFFEKHFNMPYDTSFNQVKYFTLEELNSTKTGQISTSLGGETVFSINKKLAEKNLRKIIEDRSNNVDHLRKVITEAKELSGYRKPEGIEDVVFTGRYHREGYTIDKYFIPGEDGDYPIPFLLFIPKENKGDPILYLNSDGKKKDAGIGGTIEKLVMQGHIVLAPDLVGIGELYPSYNTWEKLSSNLGYDPGKLWHSPLVIGRSIVGIHAGDIERLVIFLKKYSGLSADKIIGLAKGNCVPALLHANAFEKSFSEIILINGLISYSSVVMNRFYYGDAVPPFVYGALSGYDLSDIAAANAPIKLTLIDAFDQLKNRANKDLVDSEYQFVKNTYSKLNAIDNFTVQYSDENHSVDDILVSALKN